MASDPNDPYAHLDPPQADPNAPAVFSAPLSLPDPYESLGKLPNVQNPRPVWNGAILPFTKESNGSVSFDPLNAGLTGSAYRAATLPGRVYNPHEQGAPFPLSILFGKSNDKPPQVQMPPTFNPSVDDPRAKQVVGEATNLGGWVTGLTQNPMTRSGDLAIPGVKRATTDFSRIQGPSSEALGQSAVTKSKAYENSDVIYSQDHLNTIADQLAQTLRKKGISPDNSPGIFSSLKTMRNAAADPAGAGVSPADMKALRENIARNYENPREAHDGVYEVHKALDDFLMNPPKEGIVSGDGAAAGALYKSSRDDASAGYRRGDLEDIRRTADLKSSSANSGMNMDNTLRARVTSHILNAKKIKGYNPDEIAELEAIPTGSTTRNAMRWAGNVMGGQGGLASDVAMGGGALAASALGIPPGTSMAIGGLTGIAGRALKAGAGQGSREALKAAENTMSQRSPLFREQLSAMTDIPTTNSIPGWLGMAQYGARNAAQRDAIARQLLTTGGQGAPVEQPTIERYDPENYL
jgi:hypothetical protein